MIESKKVVYIIGVGRSGTSLLMTLLNGHSQIAFTPETHFLRFYLGSESRKKAYEKKGPKSFQRTLKQDKYFQRLNISAADLLKPFINEEKAFDLKNVYLQILQIYANRKGKTLIGDKDPRYIDYLPVVKSICPNAKLIHIYRDPRDVVLSKTKADWSAHRPYWLNAMISQIQIKNGRAKARQLFGENYYEFSYESLISKPQESLTKLLAFLGLKYEAEMLDLKKSASELVDKAELQWKDNTFKPVMDVNSEKWKTELSAIQIRSIEQICKEWFDHLKYKKSEIRLSKWKEANIRLMASFEGLQEKLYKYQLKKQSK